jgi:hypothetical protein
MSVFIVRFFRADGRTSEMEIPAATAKEARLRFAVANPRLAITKIRKSKS